MAGVDWMIYGANGFTGRVLVDHARARGLRPIVAGRREEAIRPLAELHGLPYRVFSLEDPAAAARALDGVGTMLLAAGPFSATSAPAIDACLEARTSYLDITGEPAVIEATASRGEAAKHAGIVLLPGAGFDVVPSDCLAAALHGALPSATRLVLALDLVGSPGPGSLKTVLEGAAAGGLVRRRGALTMVAVADRARRIPFPRGDRWAMAIPWGDLASAQVSTGIGDIEVYLATPLPVIGVLRASRHLLGALRDRRVRGVLDRAIGRWVEGPAAARRSAGRATIWGRVEDDAGRSVEGVVETPETTTLTAHTAIDIAVRIQAGDVPPGFATPSLAFGAAYLEHVPGTHLSVGLVEGPARGRGREGGDTEVAPD